MFATLATPAEMELRQNLARCLLDRLAELRIPADTAFAMCNFLVQFPETVSKIDAGESIILCSKVGWFAPALLSSEAGLDLARRTTGEGRVAIDVAPLMTLARRFAAARNGRN